MATSMLIKKLYMKLYCLKHNSVQCQQGVLFNQQCDFEGKNFISMGTSLRNVKMGFGSYTGAYCHLGSVKIGRYSSIGPYVKTVSGRHPTRDFVSIHPVFYSANPSIGFSYVSSDKYEEIHYAVDDGRERYAVEIGNDVWIGAGVTIVDGVTIGDGAVVGANSLVLKDVEPYSIVAGTPAQIIRKRFSDEDIEYLLRARWWNLDEQILRQYADCFENMEQFKKCFPEIM